MTATSAAPMAIDAVCGAAMGELGGGERAALEVRRGSHAGEREGADHHPRQPEAEQDLAVSTIASDWSAVAERADGQIVMPWGRRA